MSDFQIIEKEFKSHLESGNVAELKKLLSESMVDPNYRDSDGDTLLMIACAHNQHLCVEQLLKNRQVDHNLPDNDGFTPLVVAAYHGHYKTVLRFILSERKLKDVEKARNEAARKGHPDVARILGAFISNPTKTRAHATYYVNSSNGGS
jgi:ankyrin repeat protein